MVYSTHLCAGNKWEMANWRLGQWPLLIILQLTYMRIIWIKFSEVDSDHMMEIISRWWSCYNVIMMVVTSWLLEVICHSGRSQVLSVLSVRETLILWIIVCSPVAHWSNTKPGKSPGLSVLISAWERKFPVNLYLCSHSMCPTVQW